MGTVQKFAQFASRPPWLVVPDGRLRMAGIQKQSPLQQQQPHHGSDRDHQHQCRKLRRIDHTGIQRGGGKHQTWQTAGNQAEDHGPAIHAVALITLGDAQAADQLAGDGQGQQGQAQAPGLRFKQRAGLDAHAHTDEIEGQEHLGDHREQPAHLRWLLR